MDTRIQKDSLGEMEIEAKNYWGSQTQRTLMHFPNTGEKIHPNLIRSIALIKKAAAMVNLKLEKLSDPKAQAIIHACDEVISGKLSEHFPLGTWQSGSGTQTHMNVNEVIANRASELMGGRKGDESIHPNDDVNISQSTNDVFSTAIHLCAIDLITQKMIPSLKVLSDSFMEKYLEYEGVYKLGRTHMMDAVPMSAGREFETFAHQINFHEENLKHAISLCSQIPIGGTAIGSGINSEPEFAEYMVWQLSNLMDIQLRVASNKYSLISSHSPLEYVSTTLRSTATTLYKIANDIRLYSSGPRAGLGEYILNPNEPGSSIMPGKVNPTQSEMLTMICAQVMGLDSAIAFSQSQGHMQLNAFKPLIAQNLTQSIELLSQGCLHFEKHCIRSLKINKSQMKKNVENSLMLVTALSPHIGYEKAANVVKKAYDKDCSIRDIIIEENIMSVREFEVLTDIKNLIME